MTHIVKSLRVKSARQDSRDVLLAKGGGLRRGGGGFSMLQSFLFWTQGHFSGGEGINSGDKVQRFGGEPTFKHTIHH